MLTAAYLLIMIYSSGDPSGATSDAQDSIAIGNIKQDFQTNDDCLAVKNQIEADMRGAGYSIDSSHCYKIQKPVRNP